MMMVRMMMSPLTRTHFLAPRTHLRTDRREEHNEARARYPQEFHRIRGTSMLPSQRFTLPAPSCRGLKLHRFLSPASTLNACVMLSNKKNACHLPQVLFLPRAFANGGWLASSVGLSVLAGVSILCMNMLVDCSRKMGPRAKGIGFGDGMLRLFALVLFVRAVCVPTVAASVGFPPAGILVPGLCSLLLT